MVHIGVLGGTGPAGQGLALRLASVGVEVTIGSRSLERASEICEKLRGQYPERHLPIVPGTNEDAAATDLVVVATPWEAAAPIATALSQALSGKVVLSMANALTRVGGEFVPLIPPRGSVAAWVQAAVPAARVAAALHHLPARSLMELEHDLDADVLVCSDHPDATEAAGAMIARIPGLRPLDAGRLSNACAIEAFTPVLLQVNHRYKARASIRLTNIDLG